MTLESRGLSLPNNLSLLAGCNCVRWSCPSGLCCRQVEVIELANFLRYESPKYIKLYEHQILF